MEIKLDSKSFEQLANLAKLDPSYTNKQELQQSLEQMLRYVDKLHDLCVDDIIPLTHFTEVTCRLDGTPPEAALRKDVPFLTPHPEQLVSLAPKQSESYYSVPNSLGNEKSSSR